MVLHRQNILQAQTSFHHDKLHGFIRSVKSVILTNIILTSDDFIGCAVSYTWCQKIWHLIIGAEPHLTSVVRCWHKLCTHCPCAHQECVWLSTVGGWSCGRDYLRWKSGVLNRASSHMWDNWNLPMLLLRNGSLTLMYMASLMVLVMYMSLPTVEKLSTLVWWPVVLVCS